MARVLTKRFVMLSILEVGTDADGYRASVAQLRVILPEAAQEDLFRCGIVQVKLRHFEWAWSPVFPLCPRDTNVVTELHGHALAVAGDLEVCSATAYNDMPGASFVPRLRVVRDRLGTKANSHVNGIHLLVEVVLLVRVLVAF